MSETPPNVGEKAPDFVLQAGNGMIVDLHGLLARGPVLLNFLRGTW